MSEHGEVLRTLVADEQAGERELAPADDPTIRAHLRFAAVALTATAEGDLAERLDGFADELPERSTECSALYEDHLATGSGRSRSRSTCSSAPGRARDPSLDAALHRRLRIGAWIRIFLRGAGRGGSGPRRTASPTKGSAAMGRADATSRA